MSQYYLMAQLPSLDGLTDSSPVPVTFEKFMELCGRFLSKKTNLELSRLTLIPPRKHEKSGSPLVNEWIRQERALRIALGAVRGESMGKSFDSDGFDLSAEVLQTARTAVNMTDPLEAERFLNDYRLKTLEELRPVNAFADDSVFYYGIKLKLILRMREFEQERGQAEYKKIYNSIISGEGLEAVQ